MALKLLRKIVQLSGVLMHVGLLFSPKNRNPPKSQRQLKKFKIENFFFSSQFLNSERCLAVHVQKSRPTNKATVCSLIRCQNILLWLLYVCMYICSHAMVTLICTYLEQSMNANCPLERLKNLDQCQTKEINYLERNCLKIQFALSKYIVLKQSQVYEHVVSLKP